jgi:geranylgeranyl diphosphate synthase type II
VSNSGKAHGFDVEVYLCQARELVDEKLDTFLPPRRTYPQIVHEAMRYSVFAGGKRIRPALALGAGRVIGGDLQKLLYLACSLELIHTYSLVHDDLPAMDDDDYRRGKPTAHRKFGEGIAILAGNGLLTLAMKLLTEIPVDSEESDIRTTLIREICTAIGTDRGLLGGQVVDLTTQGTSYTAEQLQYIHNAKTGALIRASVVCAALLSEADQPQVEHLRLFGNRVGLAFQIVDDILDIVGTKKELGKSTGRDEAEQKATYPALFGIAKSREKVESLILEAIEALNGFGSRAEPLIELARFVSVRRF